MFGVTGINAVIATRFAKAENWFSSLSKRWALESQAFGRYL